MYLYFQVCVCVCVADIAGFEKRRADCAPRVECVLHGAGPRGLKPPCPNPDALLPTQPAPWSSTRPAHHQYQHPSSTPSSVTHTLSFLSPAVCASPSLPPLPQSGQSSSLHSCPLYISPPLFHSLLQLWDWPVLLSTLPSLKESLAAILFPNFSRSLYFHSWLLLFIFFIFLGGGLNPSPLEWPVGVCLARVRGLWCRVLCPEGAPKGCDWRRDIFTTMNVQLLLLLALVGPFCAFTHASKWTLCYHRPAVSTLCPLTLSASMCLHHTTLCLFLIPVDGTVTLCRLLSVGSFYIH